jgi:DNA-binding winged helix-turn-helix (wHTH) protein/Tol biopolymer transport system component
VNGPDPTPAVAAAPFRLGDWQVHPDRHELHRDGEVRHLQPRLVALLLRLVQADGATVSRDQLLASAWRRRIVNDEVLSRSIADLRRVLDDDARAPRLIETVPKLGYRLLLPALPLAPAPRPTGFAEPAADGPQAARTAGDPAAASVAVSAAVPAPPLTPRRPGRPSRRLGSMAAAVMLALLVAVVLVLLRRESPAPAAPAAPTAGSGLQPGDLARVRPFIGEAGRHQAPRFSRDGALVAYSSVSADGASARIRLRSRDGRVEAELDHRPGQWDTCPVLAVDAGSVFWNRHDDDGCAVVRQPLPGGPVQRLATCAEGLRSCPDLSVAGDAILFSAPPAGPDRGVGLVRLDLADGRTTAISDPAWGERDTDPRWSPDGQALAFLRAGPTRNQVLVAAADGSGARPLTMPLSMSHGLTWLAPGRLLLASDSEGGRALVAVDVASGRRTLLGAPGARFPDAAADGAVVFEVARYSTGLWRVDGDAPAVALTAHRRSDGRPRLAPDGRRLLLVSNREGLDAPWLLDLDTGREQRLPTDAAVPWSYPAWLRDDAGVLLTRIGPDGLSLWRLALGADRPERIAGAPDGAYDGQADADGRHVWFRLDADPGRASELWRLALDGASPARRVHQDVIGYRSHGSGVVLQRDGEARLRHCPGSGEACTPLVDLDPGRAWALSDQAVFVQRADAGGAAMIVRIALDDPAAAAVDTGWRPVGLPGHGLDVSADGRRAIMARVELTDLEVHWLPPPP